MEIINHTPFKVLPFESITAQGTAFYTIVMRATFNITEDGMFKLAGDQEGVLVADEYYAETASSSLHKPNDLAPIKMNTDIYVTGSAKSEKGAQLESWQVNVQVGELSKSLTVFGSREWLYNKADGWILSSPETCSEVKLRYELASGGSWGDEDDGEDSDMNPIGRGCCNPDLLNKEETFLAPQILAVGEDVPALGEFLTAKGFGPIPPSWEQRLVYAGTYDSEWEENQHPLPPKDFQYDFYSAAHPDLIYSGYLKGNENVSLEGLTSAGKLTYKLPGYSISAEFTDRKDNMFGGTGRLDTLHIDVDEMKMYLVWRVTVHYGDEGAPIEKVVIQMKEEEVELNK